MSYAIKPLIIAASVSIIKVNVKPRKRNTPHVRTLYLRDGARPS